VGLNEAKILETAVRLADEVGLENLSIARLAEHLGVRPPSLYNHIGGLEDLKSALTLRGLQALSAAMRAASVGRSGEDALLAMATAWRDVAKAHPGLYAATLRSAEGRGEALGAASAELIEVVLAVLRGYNLQGERALHATRCLRSAVHGFIALELAGGFGLPLDLDESFRQLVQLLGRGLGEF